MPRSNIAFLLLGLLPLLGCASYQVGPRSLYAADVDTVYVPIFESESFRPHLGERLTEAVMKEIQQKSPYTVVASPDADSVLSGRIVRDGKQILVEDAFDEPREVQTNLFVEVTWINRRRLPIQPPATIQVPPELLGIGASTSVVPEAGQSIATSQQLAIERLAEQIVATMEQPW